MFDLQFLLVMAAVGLCTGTLTTDGHLSLPLVINNTAGTVLMLLWSLLAFTAAKRENSAMCFTIELLLPLCYVVPSINVIFGDLLPPCCACHFVRSSVLLLCSFVHLHLSRAPSMGPNCW